MSMFWKAILVSLMKMDRCLKHDVTIIRMDGRRRDKIFSFRPTYL